MRDLPVRSVLPVARPVGAGLEAKTHADGRIENAKKCNNEAK
jgi:hypothetical protein